MAYSFDQIFAADPSNPSNVAQNASITIFAPGDTSMTPIAITDPDGQALANPIPVNANGFGSAFMAGIDRVAWYGGGFTGFFTSYEGMKQVAVDAQAAAETAAATAGADAAVVATAAIGTATADAEAAAASASTAASNSAASATAAANSAALVGAPADTAMAAAANNSGSQFRGALNATILDKIKTDSVPRWKATTAYLAGDKVLSPGGDIVSAKANFTSGATYSAANWDLSTSYASTAAVAAKLDTATAATTYVSTASTKTVNTKLRPFFAALANRENAPVNILIVGDSILEGYGATALKNRAIERAGASLRSRLAIGAGAQDFGYIPCYYESLYAGASFTTSVARAGTGIDGRRDPSYGLGKRSQRLANGDSLTFTFTGTAFDYVYTQGPITGVANIVIDGGAPNLVNTVNGAIVSGKTWRSPTLTDGPHTVIVTRDASGDAETYAEGLAWYRNTETKGLRIWDGSHAGYQASSFAAGGAWFDTVKTTAADLVVMEFIANETGAGTPAATYKANLISLQTSIRAQLTALGKVYPIPFVILLPPEQATQGAVSRAAYVAAAQEVADADPYTVLLNLADKMPTPISNTPSATAATANLGFYADIIHLSNKGQTFAGDILAELITPA